MKYDIFISYRREGGYDTAKHLNDLLVRDGYRVSFDIDTLRNGDLINCLINFENNVPAVSKIISINGIEPSKLVRPIFEEMKCSSLDEPIKFTLKNLDFLNNIL